MNEHSASTPSNGKPLYRDAHQPPTERWPASVKNFTNWASTENFFSKASSPPRKVKETFILDWEVVSTWQA